MRLVDEAGTVLGVLDPSGKFVSHHPLTEGWALAVPSIRAQHLDDGTIVEKEAFVSADDPNYGLAFADTIEERGWRFED